tara:strand:- start:1281 stop:2411 length:1131 start_codon:yes stop_codon:yes gene_type:complete
MSLSRKEKKNKILVIGAGPVGCTIAEILSKKSFEVRLIDSRDHIAGNCYDFKNEFGILVHKYGPHYFRTNNKNIIKYLNKFTKWIPGNYVVNSYVDKQYYEFPINLNTINKFFKKNFNSKNAKKFLLKIAVKSKKKNFETFLKSRIGSKMYEKFYKNYTTKQWGINPKLLSDTIAKRIPVRLNKNKDYISANYRLMPKHGFTKMFKNMITHRNIKIELKKKYKFSDHDLKKYNFIVYTGPIDAFFNFKFGKLGWRSLKFNFETYKRKNYQHCVQVNYPNNFKFTRKVEYKYVTQQKSIYTTISKEYPRSSGEPYYPRSTKEDKKILSTYQRYIKEYEKKNLYFAGRLAQYIYINTDEAIEIGITTAKRILKKISNK